MFEVVDKTVSLCYNNKKGYIMEYYVDNMERNFKTVVNCEGVQDVCLQTDTLGYSITQTLKFDRDNYFIVTTFEPEGFDTRVEKIENDRRVNAVEFEHHQNLELVLKQAFELALEDYYRSH